VLDFTTLGFLTLSIIPLISFRRSVILFIIFVNSINFYTNFLKDTCILTQNQGCFVLVDVKKRQYGLVCGGVFEFIIFSPSLGV